MYTHSIMNVSFILYLFICFGLNRRCWLRRYPMRYEIKDQTHLYRKRQVTVPTKFGNSPDLMFFFEFWNFESYQQWKQRDSSPGVFKRVFIFLTFFFAHVFILLLLLYLGGYSNEGEGKEKHMQIQKNVSKVKTTSYRRQRPQRRWTSAN